MPEIIEAFAPPEAATAEPFVEIYPEFVARHWGRHAVIGPEVDRALFTYVAAFANLAGALVCGLPARPDFDQLMSICGMGLIGETGEVVELLKKHVRDDVLDRGTLLLELGDVLFYFTRLGQYVGENDLLAHARKALHALIGMCGFTLAQVERANVEKLEVRYGC